MDMFYSYHCNACKGRVNALRVLPHRWTRRAHSPGTPGAPGNSILTGRVAGVGKLVQGFPKLGFAEQQQCMATGIVRTAVVGRLG